MSDARSDFPDNTSVPAVNQSSCYITVATHSLYFGICSYTIIWYSALTSCTLFLALPASSRWGLAGDVLEAFWVFHTTTPSLPPNQVIKDIFCTGLTNVLLYLPTCPDVLDSEVSGMACIILNLPSLLSEAISVTAVKQFFSLC